MTSFLSNPCSLKHHKLDRISVSFRRFSSSLPQILSCCVGVGRKNSLWTYCASNDTTLMHTAINKTAEVKSKAGFWTQ
jgi:hypothetical protein